MLEQTKEVVTADISSLNALAGQSNPRSLRVVGEIGYQHLHVLIDSGSTHNFIKPQWAERLGLKIQSIPAFQVYIGNDDFLLCRFQCLQVPLVIQGHTFKLDFYILPIEGPNIVLGIQWLQHLGKISIDYRAMTMEFCWESNPVILRGGPIQTPNMISLHQFHALLSKDVVHSLFELHPIINEKLYSDTHSSSSELNLPTHLPEQITLLLQQYKTLFSPHTGLPPHRLIDHKIHLLPTSKPVNVRPYRYPHFQKKKMKKLVKEMLEHGIIKPSHNPFSSPVLLVKKKDGTYRFCVDYRALNAVTVQDKFHIPTIDELFNEL